MVEKLVVALNFVLEINQYFIEVVISVRCFLLMSTYVKSSFLFNSTHLI